MPAGAGPGPAYGARDVVTHTAGVTGELTQAGAPSHEHIRDWRQAVSGTSVGYRYGSRLPGFQMLTSDT